MEAYKALGVGWKIDEWEPSGVVVTEHRLTRQIHASTRYEV